ncbi:MAG: carbohydrate porin [Planctomycetes bacterium]|nr:carbohydrate porin [Planctomycetota bacterium]
MPPDRQPHFAPATIRRVLALGWITAAAVAQGGAQERQEPTPRLQGYPHRDDGIADTVWTRAHLTGDWGGLRTWLQARGITPELFTTTDASLVTAGGVDPGGTAVRTLVDATISFASEPLLGFRGGTLFVDLQLQRGDDGSLDTGDLQRYSDIDHDHEFDEVAMLWYEQALCDDTVFVKVGKNDTNTEFDVAPHADHFLHASFGHSPNVLAMPTYPDPAFGAQVFWQPGGFYAGAGLYDGAAQSGVRTGERGPATVFAGPDDLFGIAEAGAMWAGRHPGRLGIGLWRHTGEFQRFDGGTDDKTTGCYGVLDQSLWRVGDGDGERGVGAFAMYAWADPTVSAIEHHGGAGLAYDGPFAQRPHDVAGLGASYGAFSRAPGAGFIGGAELAVECFYEMRLTPWLTVKPVLTWLDDPAGAPGVDDAVVLTLRTAITF